MTRPCVLVTGAGGFIGGRVAALLAQSGTATVRAGISRPGSAGLLAGAPVDIVVCDVTSQAALDAALQGVDAVVHCALTKGAEGIQLLLDRARAAGVRKLVFTSSVAVYGTPTGVVHEDTALTPPITHYGAGKRRAEAACHAFADDRCQIAVLRPTLVYGPGSTLWTMPYFARFASGRWRHLGALGEGRCNLVYVDDVAHFVQFLLGASLPAYSVFNANGPEVPSWNSYLDRFNAALGHPPLQAASRALPWRVRAERPVRLLSRLLRAPIPALDRLLALSPNLSELQHYTWDVTYTMDAAAHAGFVPQTTVDDGIAATVEWARATGVAG